jgi:hypothetical protein
VGTLKLGYTSHELLHAKSGGALLVDALSAVVFPYGSHGGSGLWDVASK